jgi:hypothetical protein
MEKYPWQMGSSGHRQEGVETKDRKELAAGQELSVEVTALNCLFSSGLFLTHCILPLTPKTVLCLSWLNLHFRSATKNTSELGALM